MQELSGSTEDKEKEEKKRCFSWKTKKWKIEPCLRTWYLEMNLDCFTIWHDGEGHGETTYFTIHASWFTRKGDLRAFKNVLRLSLTTTKIKFSNLNNTSKLGGKETCR